MKKLTIVLSTLILGLHLLFSHAPNFQNVTAESMLDSMTAKSAVVMEFDSGELLLAKEQDKRLPIASMVKLMTVLLTMESIDNGSLALDQKLTISKNSAGMGGSQVFLDANNDYTVEDLLKSTIVASANDASVALAEAIAGSERDFVDKMNLRARELKMNNTLYANCTGLPAVSAYSCAEDVAKLLREVLKHELYFKYSTIWMQDLVHPSGRVTGLTNTNKLIRYYKGCDAGKTGSTSEAGYCLSASAKKNDMRVISVVIGAESGAKRFSESASLLDWAFANYERKCVLEKGQKLDSIEVRNAKIKQVTPILSDGFAVVGKKGEKNDLQTKFDLDSTIKAPLSQNQKIGTAYVLKNGVVIKEIDIVVECDVQKVGYFDSLKQVASNF